MAAKKESRTEGKLSLEKSFELLNEYVRKMEEEDLSLEESFSVYAKGMELVKDCSNMIDKIEKDIIILEEGRKSLILKLS